MVINKGNVLGLILLSILFVLCAGCSQEPDDALARIRHAGVLRVAMSGDYPPFNYRNQTGVLQGFDVDVARELAKQLGVKPKIVVKKWSGIIQELLAGEYDVILGSMAISEERLKRVAFSMPYYHSVVGVVVRKGSTLKALSDLKGKTVGIGAGSNYENDARELGVADIRFFEPWSDGLIELQDGNLDAMILDQIIALNAVQFGKYNIQYLGPPLRREAVAIAVRKEDTRLLKEIDKALALMKKNGFLAQLGRKVAQCEYDCAGGY